MCSGNVRHLDLPAESSRVTVAAGDRGSTGEFVFVSAGLVCPRRMLKMRWKGQLLVHDSRWLKERRSSWHAYNFSCYVESNRKHTHAGRARDRSCSRMRLGCVSTESARFETERRTVLPVLVARDFRAPVAPSGTFRTLPRSLAPSAVDFDGRTRAAAGYVCTLPP